MHVPKLEFKDFVIRRASSNSSIEELVSAVRKLNGKDTVVQIFDGKKIAGRAHLMGAYANAMIAFKNHTNRTKSIAMEMVLFAAMTTQIGTALERVGANDPSGFIIFSNRKKAIEKLNGSVVLGPEFNPSIGSMRKVARSIGINIAKKDKKGIESLVLQRMAVSRLSSD